VEAPYEDGWAHDLDALAGLIRPATRLLYLNQPHNPTGTRRQPREPPEPCHSSRPAVGFRQDKE
jgi:histidinol-phosphate/aromatic aminotransferase/cobyric acid decarboxylase-like protein